MRPVRVVVIHEYAQDTFEMIPVHDQEPVEALRADGADEALGDRVRLRRPYRRLDDPDTFTGEDGIEVTRELAVTVADQESKSRGLLLERPGELACLLCHPGAGLVGGAASEVDAAAGELNEEENIEALQRDRFDSEEVDREQRVR